jgi:hypothetical protein
MHSVRKHVMLLLPALLLVGLEARAEYRCDSPPTSIDARACEKAAEGPAALRQFIQRMRVIESLDFNDYVNEARLIAWANADLGRHASTWEGAKAAADEDPSGPDA